MLFMLLLQLLLVPVATATAGDLHRHRLQPAAGKVLHMAGQSSAEFSTYGAFLSPLTRPLAYTTYLQITELREDSNKSTRLKSWLKAELVQLGMNIRNIR